jgi:glycerol-3-phosphate responsive antiterminator
LKQHPLETLSATGEKIDQYVIFDDDTDMKKAQKPHFVHVDFWNGIQEKDYMNYNKAKDFVVSGYAANSYQI